MVEFSESEKGQLWRIFTPNLFSKVTTLIRDAILAAPKFAEKIHEVMVEENLPTRAEFENLKKRVERLSPVAAATKPKAAKKPPKAKVEETPAAEAKKAKPSPDEEAKAAEKTGEPKKGSAKKKLSALSEFAQKEDS